MTAPHEMPLRRPGGATRARRGVSEAVGWVGRTGGDGDEDGNEGLAGGSGRGMGPGGRGSGGSGGGAGGVLTLGQLALLGAVQDRLVPAEGDLPGAGELGAAGVVDGYLGADPALRPLLLDALRAVEVVAARVAEATPFEGLDPETQVAVLQAVEAEAPLPFRVLVRQTYNAYYTHPAVLAAVGYTLPAPQPEGFAVEAFDDGRLDPVRRRGPIWRDA